MTLQSQHIYGEYMLTETPLTRHGHKVVLYSIHLFAYILSQCTPTCPRSIYTQSVILIAMALLRTANNTRPAIFLARSIVVRRLDTNTH
jgi:hypothetical protein